MANGMQMTFDQLNPETFQKLTATVLDFRARLSVLLGSDEVLKIQEGLSFLKSCGLLRSETLSIYSLKTSQDSLTMTGGVMSIAFPDSKSRRGRVIDEGETTPTLDTGCALGRIEGARIRKLTPRECFRLQGFPDEYFGKAAMVNSDSQLYKQAGNSVTVPVIYEIAKRL